MVSYHKRNRLSGGIHPGLSLYLDLLRFCAAAEVFPYHLIMLTGPPGWRPLWASFGHEAVIVFFVLSGYVISYAAANRDTTARQFALSRLARVFSVSVPALVLTVALDWAAAPLNPALYHGFAPLHSPLPRFAISLLLLNESWISVQAFSNGPYWSLCYETAYYAIFASVFYLAGRRRGLALTAALSFAGIRTLLLLPVWLMGCWAFFENRSRYWHPLVHGIWFLLPVPALWFYQTVHLDRVTVELAFRFGWTSAQVDLGHSRQALSDIYLGLAVMLHFIGAKNAGPILARLLRPIAASVRRCANYTFTRATCKTRKSLRDSTIYTVIDEFQRYMWGLTIHIPEFCK